MRKVLWNGWPLFYSYAFEPHHAHAVRMCGWGFLCSGGGGLRLARGACRRLGGNQPHRYGDDVQIVVVKAPPVAFEFSRKPASYGGIPYSAVSRRGFSGMLGKSTRQSCKASARHFGRSYANG